MAIYPMTVILAMGTDYLTFSILILTRRKHWNAAGLMEILRRSSDDMQKMYVYH
jgi:hypothetical protein